jgi:hypothetical protein
MISIIISSRDAEQLAAVTDNIQATIGVPLEIISIDNSGAKMGICQAYNQGAKQSQYEILCFMHEDICMRTQNWGQVLERILSDQSIGLVGIAGSVSRVDFPAPWGGYVAHWRSKVVQHHSGGRYTDSLEFNPKHEICSDVAVVDGCWMACRRETWERHPFDAQTFQGFHLYDEDLSMQIRQDARVCVTFEIILEHFSAGGYNREWFAAAEIFHRKWKNHLPVLISDPGRVSLRRARRVAFDLLWNRLKTAGYSRKELITILCRRPRFVQELIAAWVFRTFIKIRQIILSAY